MRQKPALLMLAGLFVSLVLSGCVYVRLIQVKRQFAEVERHVIISSNEGLTFTLRQPVLLKKDILFLAKSPPSRTFEHGESFYWTYNFLKKSRSGEKDERNFSIAVKLCFKDETLYQYSLPARFAHHLDPGFIRQSLRALGRAELTLDPKGLSCRVPREAAKMSGYRPPSMTDILSLFGEPYDESMKKNEIKLTFKYRLDSQSGLKGKRPSRQTIYISFRRSDYRLVSAEVRFSGRTLLLRYPADDGSQ
jgi:hypothetical protein